MTAKEYLGQAYHLDQRINSKLEQVCSLSELATKCTSTLTGMPRNPHHGVSSMEDIIAKIVDLQAEVDRDIDQLVDIKRQIITAIKAVDNEEYQTLLELRFLCGYTWEEIATKMGYSIQHTYRMYNHALSKISVTASGE